MTGPTLEWTGKRPPDPTSIRDRVRVEWDDEHAAGRGFLLRADAVDAAAWLHPTIGGAVDLVYIDPPFAVGQDFAAAVRRPGGSERQFAYCDRWASEATYLDFLHHAICLSHDLLRAGGAMYLHVDRRASHWARCILAEVFGDANERGAIVWNLGNGVKSRNAWGCSHNDILCFSKGDGFKFRPDRAALREPHAESSRETHFRGVDDDGRRFRDRAVNGRVYRYYADEGRLVGSVWSDCPSMSARSPIMDESTGYPTQKPEKLLERIIEASTDAGDLVVDLCCGSGTTPAVAARLGRRWVACDVGRLAIERTGERLRARGETFRMGDLVDREPGLPRNMARLLRLEEPVTINGGGLAGRAGDRSVGVWPHGITVTAAMLASIPASAGGTAAFGTRFGPESAHGGVKRWRYHPESASAASLRSVVFASQDDATLLRIGPGSNGWVERAISPQELATHRGGRMVDAFGFTHTLRSAHGDAAVRGAESDR